MLLATTTELIFIKTFSKSCCLRFLELCSRLEKECCFSQFVILRHCVRENTLKNIDVQENSNVSSSLYEVVKLKNLEIRFWCDPQAATTKYEAKGFAKLQFISVKKQKA